MVRMDLMNRTDSAMTSTEPAAAGCGGERNCKHDREIGCEDCKVRLFSVCGALEPAELEQLDAISQVRHFAAKTMLFDQGAMAGAVFNVTEGIVRLYKSLPD